MARGLFNLFLRIFEAVGTLSLAISGRERERRHDYWDICIQTACDFDESDCHGHDCIQTKTENGNFGFEEQQQNQHKTSFFLRQVAKGSYRKVEGIFYFGNRR